MDETQAVGAQITLAALGLIVGYVAAVLVALFIAERFRPRFGPWGFYNDDRCTTWTDGGYFSDDEPPLR